MSSQIFGVVSWGPVLCGDKPSVYASLPAHIDWLRRVIKGAGGLLPLSLLILGVSLESRIAGSQVETPAATTTPPPRPSRSR